MKNIVKTILSPTAVLPVLLVLSVGAGQAVAANDWLNQGTSLLKALGNQAETKTEATGTNAAGLALGLSGNEIVAGLKQALEKGAQTVVNRLGSADGFNSDSAVHIPLPENLSMAKKLLDKVGMGFYAEDVELKLNRAAEAAVPKAKTLFLDAISQMKIEDAQAILQGPDDAATSYFKEKMSSGLITEMSPVINQTLASVGALQAYEQMMSQYKNLPFVPDVKGNLTSYTAGKAVDGIFHYLATEEKAIRENPAKRTTELLQKVFN